MFHGAKNVTTAGTDEVLLAAQDLPVGRVVKRLTIQAKPGNTGSIYVGVGAASSSDYGIVLQARDSVSFGIGDSTSDVDLCRIWLDSSVSGEGVTYIGEA
jgi:Flp pilus assembly protein CpaB